MRSKILEVLRNSTGYISGQELCERFGVTRTAIWKAVNQLKEAGYEIEAVKNKGYHMVDCPDKVTATELLSLMSTKWAGKKVEYVETVGSTNNMAKKAAENGAEHGVLIVADHQETGKGRRGRSWVTPRSTAIAMTLILRPDLPPSKASMLTIVMGLAVARAIRELLGLEAEIKWPNDVVVDNKKVCGILTEMSAEMDAINYLVVGAGINVNIEEFSEDLKEIATSLCIQCGHRIHRAQIICECMKWFEVYYESFVEYQDLSGLMEEYNNILVNRGKAVKVLEPGNEYTGVSEGINRLGELLVTKENHECVRVFAGEVSVRGIYGYV